MTQKNYEIVLYKEALEDLKKIENYIVVKFYNPIAANRVSEKIHKTIENILPFPYAYPLVDVKRVKKYNIRKTVCGKYLIFFRVVRHTVEIVGVFYSRRLLKNIYDELIYRTKLKGTNE